MSNKEELIESLQEKIGFSTASREGLLKLLAVKDAKIDKIDDLIINIDKKIPPLIDAINTAVTAVKTTHEARITAGCRSDLTWEVTETGTNDVDDSEYTIYTVVKNNTRQQLNYYGQKYYRKPLNRDFGSNIIVEITGDILKNTNAGIGTIIVTGEVGIEGVKVGDIVTDNLDTPDIFSSGNLPRVTGIGSTDFIGVTTALQGNVHAGSNVFAKVGIGTTLATNIGDSVILAGVFPEGTVINAIGTATTDVDFYNPTTGATASVTVEVPSLTLSNNALATQDLTSIEVGTTSVKSTITVDQKPNSIIRSQQFTIIRDTEGIDDNFDFQKSPLQPVSIGIIGNQSGIGHVSEIVNNGSPPGPVQWLEQNLDPEPAVGAGNVVYYTGLVSWPVVTDEFGTGAYATLGQTLVSTSSTLGESTTTATFTSTSPTGAVDGVGACATLDTNIANAQTAYTNALNDNLTEINRLNDLSQALRRIRDDEELEAYGLLQGAAFERSRENQNKSDIDTLESLDLSEFEP